MSQEQPFEETPAKLRCLRSEEDGRCATYELVDEDHTLGNALRHMILKNPEVKFCGYALPHPNERKINLQIQVYQGQSVDALEKGLRDLKALNEIVKQKILAEKERFGHVQLQLDDTGPFEICSDSEHDTAPEAQEAEMDEEW